MAAGSYRTTLAHRGLQPFLWTQFLGAFNDNVLKIIVTLLAMGALGRARGVWVAGGVFILPFLLFSGYAGHFADKLSKRKVLVAVKAAEVGIMAVACMGLASGQIGVLLAALFLMGAHSTFFSPAKYGIVPELVPDEELSRANGLLEMSTFAAIVLGSSVGGELFGRWPDRPWYLGGLLVLIAAAGWLASLGVPRVPAAKPRAVFAASPWAEIERGLARVWPSETLRMTMVGVSYFWLLGALLQMALLPFGADVLHVGEASAARLYTPLAVGIALGSLAAGRLSGLKIELGLVPIGAFGMGVFSLVFAASSTYWGAAIALAVLGFSGGLFAVPLNALLQQRPGPDEKGRVLSANNFFNTIGILLAVVILAAGGDYLGLSIRQILVLMGVLTLASNIYILAKLPDFFVRFVLWLLTHTIYRITIAGSPHIPQRGPALLIANHVSMIDGALIGACIQRFVRFVVYQPYYRLPGIHLLMRRMHAIPIAAGKTEVMRAIERARTDLAQGHVVCIFVEGAVSRTGNLLPFKHGFERMVTGLNVPVIPVFLDRVWGSIFSFKRERFFWKLPERLPYPVTVAFGPPLPSTVTAQEARIALMELGGEAMRHRRARTDLLHTAFMRVARRRWRRLAIADSLGQTLTYGRTLVGALVLGRALARRTAGEETIGLLLPTSVGGALANIAVLMAGRVPVNLNFTVGREALEAAVEQAEIRTIVTSKRFLDRVSIEQTPNMVLLEDLLREATPGRKAIAFLQARCLPVRLLSFLNGGRHRTCESLATIIFSSGSTGIPKGVMLTHANILTNGDALAQIFPMGRDDCFIGVLPFFHSFGFTGTLWFPLLQGCRVAYHFNPMDAKTVGELAGKYQGAMLISTPTFCNAYVRRCTKEQFAHLRYAIVGAEKLREPLARAFEERFGVPLLEGYGCTEMSPVVAVNRPDAAHPREPQVGRKFGSVGHPVPGVAAKVVDQTTGEGPLFDRDGLLLVKGPNLMAGYLKQPERTAEVIQDGWYITSDIARMDEDGFIFITDRVSRFSKIAGEMVPHIRIEEAINAILGDSCSAVTAVPDAAKGERLVAFYTREDITPESLWEQLARTELPKLWLPRRENLLHIETIPTLGTGKIDLRKLRELAIERTGGAEGVRPG
jgi:acyl-[acyl-carrier-protein]-phospholipid O-acyltransferase/long-chain-fatty-acid--[acyl-carrier-protein] ligase